jgi:hypothetical protein
MRDYPCRLLRKNHTSHRPTNLLFIDTETKIKKKENEEHHRMDFAWTCYLKQRRGARPDTEVWKYWTDTERLWRYVERLATNKTVLYVFGHNVFFDLQASDFFYYFTRWGWVLDFFYDKGMTYMLFIHKDKKRIKCLSTTNYYPVSLEELGKMLGLPKLEVDFETTPRDELIEYCRRDVEICKATMLHYLDFIDKHDLGRFSGSRASQAMAAYRHRFMKKKIYIHEDEEVQEFERKAYYGGRCECGELGEIKGGPFVSLDINSMYPFVMKTFQYPVKLLDYFEYPDLDQLQNILKKYCVVAHCWLSTDEPAYAVKRFQKIIFPVGDFQAYLCTQGVKYALEQGHLRDVIEMYVYEKASIFVEYVDYFYDLRQQYKKQGNAIMARIAKDFLNSLYGKWAQRQPVIEEETAITFDGYFREETPDLVTGETEIVTKLMNKITIQYGTMPARNSFVAIAAHVTEYARFHLWNIMKGIGFDRVLYCDTDSVKIRKRDLKHVKHKIDQHELGALKLEEEFEYFKIHGPKDYETENTVKVKGVPGHAEKIDESVYKYTAFSRQETHLRRQITRYFIAQPTVKVLKRTYTKGKVLKSGKVVPITLRENAPPSLLLLTSFASASKQTGRVLESS